MSQQNHQMMEMDGEVNVRELHSDLARKYRNVGDKVDAIWRDFSPKQREKAVRESIADGNVLKHRYDRTYGVLCDYMPEYNLRDMGSKPEHFLSMFKFRALTPLSHQVYEGVNEGLGDREMIELAGISHAPSSQQEMIIFLEGDYYGGSFKPGPKSGGVFPSLPFRDAEFFVLPRSLGGPILWRQQFLLTYLNYLVEDILTLGSEITHKKAPERDVNAALVNAVSNLNIQPKPLRGSLPEVCAQAMDSKAALEDYLVLLQTEPTVLDHAVSNAFWTRVELVSDDRGRILPVVTDRYLSAAFFSTIFEAFKAIAIWEYVGLLLNELGKTTDKVKRGLVLQELSNTCHLEYRRAQEILKRKIAIHFASKRLKRMSNNTSGQFKVVMKGQPADWTVSDPQLHYILRLCHPETSPADAVQWIQKLDDHNARHDEDRKKIREAEMTALNDLAIIVSFMHMTSTAISMVPVSRKSGLLFTARLAELDAELNDLKPKADLGDYLVPIHNLLEPQAATGALAALDEFIVREAGTRLGSIYEDIVQDSLKDLEKKYDEADAKARLDKGDKTTYVPLPSEEMPLTDARLAQRRAKEKTRPAKSFVYTITSLPESTQSVVPDPKQRFQVKASTASVFTTLFDKSEARGSVAWADFESAMADLGFSVTPKGGSIYTFNPPVSMESRPITLHRPHVSEIGGYKILIIARRLERVYNWTADSFVVA